MYLVFGIALAAGTALIELFMEAPRPEVFVAYGLLVPIGLALPRLLYYKSAAIKQAVTKNWYKYLEQLLLLIVLFNAPASLWWHRQGLQYDRFLHFIVALLTAFLLALLIAAVLRSQKKEDRKKLVLGVTAGLMGVGVFVWEVYQWSVDALLGTGIFGDAFQPVLVDVTEDIIFGLAGAGVALVLLLFSYQEHIHDKLS